MGYYHTNSIGQQCLDKIVWFSEIYWYLYVIKSGISDLKNFTGRLIFTRHELVLFSKCDYVGYFLLPFFLLKLIVIDITVLIYCISFIL